jgi:hypothetical protein
MLREERQLRTIKQERCQPILKRLCAPWALEAATALNTLNRPSSCQRSAGHRVHHARPSARQHQRASVCRLTGSIGTSIKLMCWTFHTRRMHNSNCSDESK